MSTHSTISYKLWLVIAGTIIFWASAYTGIRIGLSSYSPGSLALLRFLFASITMLAIYWRLPNKRKPKTVDMLNIAFLGIIGFGLYNIALNTGEQSISAAIAGFTIALIPVFMTVLARIFFMEQIPWLALFGIFISVGGILLITVGESHSLHSSKGVFYTLLAAFAGAFYSVFQKPLLKKYHPIEFIAFAIWGATLFLLIYWHSLLHEINHATYKATLTAIYLGVFPAAIGYLCWSYVLNYLSTAKAGSLLYVIPLVSTLMGFVLLGEMPAIISLVGGMISLAGAIIISMAKNTQEIIKKSPITENETVVADKITIK